MFVDREIVIDVIRVIAILGVILIHVTSRTLEVSGYNILLLPTIFAIDIVSRFSVPIFFIVSGYALSLRYKDGIDIRSFYKRRVSKLLLPYLIWSSLYIFYDSLRGSRINVFNYTAKIITGDAAIHLYFIPTILILYLLFPLLKRAIKKINLTIFVLYTILEIIMLLVDYLHGPFLNYNPLRISVLSLYLFIIGMISFEYKKQFIKLCKNRFSALCLTILIYIVTLLYETKKLFLSSHNVDFITSQWQPTIFTYSILLWGFLLIFFQRRLLRYRKHIIFLSNLSFFVFFIHIFYLNIFWKAFGSYIFSKSEGHALETFWFTPLVFFFVAILSYLTAHAIRVVPKVNKALGIG